jgi:hypothetical protein
MLGHAVTKIYGNRRLEAVEISRVDDGLNLIPYSSFEVPCDTLLLSVGLMPENEISKAAGIKLDINSSGPIVNEYLESSIEGIFACGNSLFVNDLADNVTEDGYTAAECAAKYLSGDDHNKFFIDVLPGRNVTYIVPQRISGNTDVIFRIRARCPARNAYIEFPEIGFKKKERFVLPGELIFVKMDRANFEGIKSPDEKIITVNIKESE